MTGIAKCRNHTFAEVLVAGAVGGLIGSFAMNQFQSAVAEFKKRFSPREKPMMLKLSAPDNEDATVKAAERLSEVFDHHLREEEKKLAGPAVHYTFGILTGALYGALSEKIPGTSTGAGSLYGSAVWLAADETAVPATGLSSSKGSVSSHVQALASHVAYGITLDLTRRVILRII